MLTLRSRRSAVLAACSVLVLLAGSAQADAAELPGASARPLAVPATLVGGDGPTSRIAIFSTATGRVVRYLTPLNRSLDEGLPVFSANRRAVLFVRDTGQRSPSAPRVWGTFAVKATGGPAKEIRTALNWGAQPMGVGPHGAWAGMSRGQATDRIRAVNARGQSAWLAGQLSFEIELLAWAPDGLHLALGRGPAAPTEPNQVWLLDTRLFAGTSGSASGSYTVVPCPLSLPGCGLRGVGYAPDGSLYSVAENAGRTRSALVRFSPAAGRTSVVVPLPAVARTYRVFVAPSGAVLVSADANQVVMTSSAFVAIWDGIRLRRLSRSILQAAW